MTGETSIRVILAVDRRPGHRAAAAADTRKSEIALDGRLGVAPRGSYDLDEGRAKLLAALEHAALRQKGNS
jgi:hypothetical protein